MAVVYLDIRRRETTRQWSLIALLRTNLMTNKFWDFKCKVFLLVSANIDEFITNFLLEKQALCLPGYIESFL
jgi:hypothetical protein